MIALASLLEVRAERISGLLRIAVLHNTVWDWNFSLGIRAGTGLERSFPSLGRSRDRCVSASDFPFWIPGRKGIKSSYCASIPAHLACRQFYNSLVLNVCKLW